MAKLKVSSKPRENAHNHIVNVFQACDWGALDRMFGRSPSYPVMVNPILQKILPASAYNTWLRPSPQHLSLDPWIPSKYVHAVKSWTIVVMVHTQNLETGEVIPGPPGNIVFHLSGAKMSMSAEECLASLRSSWDDRHNRFRLTEEEFLAAFNRYLLDLANARVQQVRTWLEQNTSRFVHHADVQALFRRFQELAKELRSGVALCGATCGTCSLLCLSGRQHDGAHDCYTNHKCPQECDFFDQHDWVSVPACDMA